MKTSIEIGILMQVKYDWLAAKKIDYEKLYKKGKINEEEVYRLSELEREALAEMT
jgi:hypothetical protein